MSVDTDRWAELGRRLDAQDRQIGDIRDALLGPLDGSREGMTRKVDRLDEKLDRHSVAAQAHEADDARRFAELEKRVEDGAPAVRVGKHRVSHGALLIIAAVVLVVTLAGFVTLGRGGTERVAEHALERGAAAAPAKP